MKGSVPRFSRGSFLEIAERLEQISPQTNRYHLDLMPVVPVKWCGVRAGGEGEELWFRTLLRLLRVLFVLRNRGGDD